PRVQFPGGECEAGALKGIRPANPDSLVIGGAIVGSCRPGPDLFAPVTPSPVLYHPGQGHLNCVAVSGPDDCLQLHRAVHVTLAGLDLDDFASYGNGFP